MVGTTNDVIHSASSPSSSPQHDDVTRDKRDNDVFESDADDVIDQQRSETKSSMPFSSARGTRAALHGRELGEDGRVRLRQPIEEGEREGEGEGWGGATQGDERRQPAESKPCYQLCRRVELNCPFLNPSTADGGRPVFACPQLIGSETDTYSENEQRCYNPYQNYQSYNSKLGKTFLQRPQVSSTSSSSSSNSQDAATVFEKGRSKRDGPLSASSSSLFHTSISSSQNYPSSSRLHHDPINVRRVSSSCEKQARSSLVLFSRNILDHFFLQIIYHQLIDSSLITSFGNKYYVTEEIITSQEMITASSVSFKHMYHPIISSKSLYMWLKHWLGIWREKMAQSFPLFDNFINTGGTNIASQENPSLLNITSKLIRNGEKLMRNYKTCEKRPKIGNDGFGATNGRGSYQSCFWFHKVSDLRARDTFQPIRGAVESNNFDQIRKDGIGKKASPSSESRDYFKTSKGRTSFIYLFVNFTHLFLYTMMLKLFVFYSVR